MFPSDPSQICREATAADVDGWDSLAHTVLMVRLEKRLGMRISERVAAKAGSIGELIDLLCAELAVGEQ
jgi:acyl carrier protein